MLNVAEKREYERQEKLEELQGLIYKFDGEELQSVNRRVRYPALARAFLDEIEGRVTHATTVVLFVGHELIPALKEFSKTQEELQFMYAETLQFLSGIIVNEAARELSSKEHSNPE